MCIIFVYAFEVKQINSAQKFGSYLLAVPYILPTGTALTFLTVLSIKALKK